MLEPCDDNSGRPVYGIGIILRGFGQQESYKRNEEDVSSDERSYRHGLDLLAVGELHKERTKRCVHVLP